MNPQVHFNLSVRAAGPNGLSMSDHDYAQAVTALSACVQAALNSVPQLAVDFTAGRSHVELFDVYEFHRKMMVPMSPVPALLDPETHEYRCKFMDEELREFKEAYDEGDLDKAFDSLLDLVYVAVGTALKMGLPWPGGWQRVHGANMTKRLAKPDGSDSKRGSPVDVVKPENFVAPSHWAAMNMREGDRAPVFNAMAAVAHLAECRKTGRPMLHPSMFITYPQTAERRTELHGLIDTALRTQDKVTGDHLLQEWKNELAMLEGRPHEVVNQNKAEEVSPATLVPQLGAITSLEDDKPLTGGCTDPGDTCESCQ